MKKVWLSFLLGGLLLVGCSKSPTDPAPVLYKDGYTGNMTTLPKVMIRYTVSTPASESVDITYTAGTGQDVKVTAKTPWTTFAIVPAGWQIPQAGISVFHTINTSTYTLSSTPITVTVSTNDVLQQQDTDTYMAQAIIFFKKAH